MCLLCVTNKLPQTVYCERGNSQDLLAEPINAFTNLAFPVFGYLGYKLLKEKNIKSKEVNALPWMLSLVGLGSFIYHTARNSIALIFDALPIYFFILYAIFLTINELFNSKVKSLLILASFIGVEIALSVYVPREFLNGSIRHIAAIVFIIFVGWLAVKRYGKEMIQPLIGVIGLYAFAIFFRSIDAWICTWLPIGTHFLWHILSAFAGYQAIYLLAVIKSSKSKTA